MNTMKLVLIPVVIVCVLFLSTISDAQTIFSADLNNDGSVDAIDLMHFHNQWHTKGDVMIEPEPGTQVDAEITSVDIPVDLQPEITFSLKNDLGEPIDPASLDTLRFTIARIVEDNLAGNKTHYVCYITNTATGTYGVVEQPSYDSGGNITDLGNGVYTYKFLNTLSGYDPSLTHTIAGQIEYEAGENTRVVNPIYHFVPDGSPVSVTREVSTTATCNQCHNPISAHGGGRIEYGFCILCHASDVIDPDTGNSVDMKVMIHKIHMGAELPSVQSGTPYQIIGYRGSVHDYSEVEFPQDNRNCTKCHVGAHGDYYKLVPSRVACGSCHDNINFETGDGHLAQSDDSLCAACHQSTMGEEFDRSIPGAHVVPEKSNQLKGLNAEIVMVSNVVAGSSPSIQFKLYEDDMTQLTPDNLSRLALTVAGPTSGDYSNHWSETITSSNVQDNGDGTFTYEMVTGIPAGAEGTYAFGLEARRSVTIDDKKSKEITLNEAADNPVVYEAVTGSVVERREVVDFNKCNVCHEKLSLHGSLRNNRDYCVMCHRPGMTDEEERPEEQMPPETVDFKVMIHKIHTGEELNNPYTVYGHNSSVNDFTKILFPGNTMDCEKCHMAGTYVVPAPSGALDTVITQAETEVSRKAPTTAACTACHDSDEIATHAAFFTSSGVEGCADCHAKNREWAYNLVHTIE